MKNVWEHGVDIGAGHPKARSGKHNYGFNNGCCITRRIMENRWKRDGGNFIASSFVEEKWRTLVCCELGSRLIQEISDELYDENGEGGQNKSDNFCRQHWVSYCLHCVTKKHSPDLAPRRVKNWEGEPTKWHQVHRNFVEVNIEGTFKSQRWRQVRKHSCSYVVHFIKAFCSVCPPRLHIGISFRPLRIAALALRIFLVPLSHTAEMIESASSMRCEFWISLKKK